MTITNDRQIPIKFTLKPSQTDPKKKVEEFETEMIANCPLQNESDRKLFASEVRALCENINQSILRLSTTGHTDEQIHAHLERKLALARESLSVKLKVFEVKEAQFKAQSSQFEQKRGAVRTRSFAPLVAPKVSLIDRKKEMSQCLLVAMDPDSVLGPLPCLQKCSVGLNEAEKKELEAAVPDLVTGKFITELASGPAMASKALNVVAAGVGLAAKGLMLGAMSEAILTADPTHYDSHMKEALKALNGENPEVNKLRREMVGRAANLVYGVAKEVMLGAISEPFSKADPYHYREQMDQARKALNGDNPEINKALREVFIEPIKRADQAVTDLDRYAQARFYTVPGIVREGIIGTGEIALSLVSSRLFRKSPEPFAAPHAPRLNYFMDYATAAQEFLVAKEFNGVLSRDLLVVRYHDAGGTYKWFMPISEGNKHPTVNDIQNAMAKLDKFGKINEVSVARIPAGESVRFLHGRAKPQIDLLSGEVRPGGGVQYRFFDFDPQWITTSRKMPLPLTPQLPRFSFSDYFARAITHFLRNESGTVKLPEFSKLKRERKFYIDLFKNIDYEIVKGGKGSHTKMINRNYPKMPMVIIPKDRELTPGVSRNLRRIYEKAINIYQDQ